MSREKKNVKRKRIILRKRKKRENDENKESENEIKGRIMRRENEKMRDKGE